MSKKRRDGDPIDRAVGQRIALRRQTLRMSQSDLGDALGVSYQQIQKYESGINRVSASSIAKLSALMRVEAAYFFVVSKYDGIESIKLDKQTLDLNYSFIRISDRNLRDSIINLIDTIVELGL